MKLDDVKRLLTRQTLFRLDSILSPKLMPIFYALGLAGILLWIVSHFFFRFSQGFGNGLWGILEIAVFGLLAFVALRILCEALLVWFKNHETAGETVQRSRFSASLLDEVRDAIRDLAEEGDADKDYAEAAEYMTPATDPAPYTPPQSTPLTPEEAVRSPSTKPGETHGSMPSSKA